MTGAVGARLRPVPYLLLVPFFLGLALFWLIPFVQGFWISLQSDTLFGDSSFVGLKHYHELLSDNRFFTAIRNTFQYALGSIVLILPFSMVMALLLQQLSARLRGWLRFLLLIPGLTSPAVLGILFLLVFSGDYGMLNHVLHGWLGLPVLDWLKDPKYIGISLILQSVWRWSGFIALFLLAGLEGIPRLHYHVARAEGAGAFQCFRYVTLPMLRPVIIFSAVFLFLDAFVLFSGAYVLLGASGGTSDAGLLIIGYMYQTAFRYGAFGSSAAMAFSIVPVVVFIVGAAIVYATSIKGQSGNAGLKALSFLSLLAVISFMLFPFIWMFFSTFKSNPEIFKTFPLLPEKFHLEYYKMLLGGEILAFPRQLLNSTVVAICSSVLATVAAAMTGYVFACFRFRGKWLLLIICIAVILVPRQVLVLPLFTWMNNLGLLDNLLAVIFPAMISGLGVVYFTIMFKKIPTQLMDTARVEGAGEYRVFWSVLPYIKSSLFTFGLIYFVLSWHEHLIPLAMLTSEQMKTAPLALASLFGSSIRRIPYAVILVGAMFSIFPAVAGYLILRKHFQSALADLVER